MAIYERMTIKGRGGALPTYQRQTGAYAPGAGVSARVSGADARILAAGSEAEGKALVCLGDTMNKAVQVGVKAYDDYSKSKATQLITQYRRDMNTALYGENGILTQKGEAALDADAQRAERARQLRDSLMTDANEYTKRYFNILADDYDADTSLKAQEYAQTEFTTMQKRNFEAAAEEWAESAMVSYANERDFDKNTGGALHFAQKRLELEGYSGEALQRGLKETSSKIFRGAIENALAGNDVDSARRLLERGSRMHGEGDGAWSRMTADDVAWGKNAIRTKQEALQAKAEANANKAAREILKGYKDAVKRAEFFGDTSALDNMAARLRAVGKSDEADELRIEAEQYAGIKEVSVFAANQPLPEVFNFLKTAEGALKEAENAKDTAEYEKQAKNLKAVTSIYNERAKALKVDPAAAVEQSNLFQLPDNATPEDRVSARLAAQERNGVLSPVPLTNQEVERIAVLYQQSKSPAAFAAQVANEYGEQSQAVIKQLVTSGKLPPDTNLALNMSASSSELLMQMNRKDAVKETENSLGVDSYIKDSINGTVRDELSDILKTFNRQGNAAVPAQILDASYKLALKYMEQGQSASDAAERAAREVIADRYEVRDGYRIPRIWDADTISNGADRYKARLAESGDVAMNVVPGLTEAQTTAKKRAILRNARWVNNPDESGLWLTVNGKPVLTNAGDVVQVSFDELTTQKEGK